MSIPTAFLFPATFSRGIVFEGAAFYEVVGTEAAAFSAASSVVVERDGQQHIIVTLHLETLRGGRYIDFLHDVLLFIKYG